MLCSNYLQDILQVIMAGLMDLADRDAHINAFLEHQNRSEIPFAMEIQTPQLFRISVVSNKTAKCML